MSAFCGPKATQEILLVICTIQRKSAKGVSCVAFMAFIAFIAWHARCSIA